MPPSNDGGSPPKLVEPSGASDKLKAASRAIAEVAKPAPSRKRPEREWQGPKVVIPDLSPYEVRTCQTVGLGHLSYPALRQKTLEDKLIFEPSEPAVINGRMTRGRLIPRHEASKVPLEKLRAGLWL